MPNGWSSSDYSLDKSVSGVVTNEPMSREYHVTAGGATHHVVKLVASGVTVVGSITAKLQSAIGSDWQDSKTVTISGNGVFYIKLNIEVAGDQTFLPLLNRARIVVTTTNAGDAATIDSVDVLQEL